MIGRKTTSLSGQRSPPDAVRFKAATVERMADAGMLSNREGSSTDRGLAPCLTREEVDTLVCGFPTLSRFASENGIAFADSKKIVASPNLRPAMPVEVGELAVYRRSDLEAASLEWNLTLERPRRWAVQMARKIAASAMAQSQTE